MEEEELLFKVNYFEKVIIKKISEIMVKKKVKGICYRIRQSRFSSQFCDLLVDSLNKKFYLAIECKSRNKPSLNFKSDFSISKGIDQITNMKNFCEKSGRKGFLFFKIRKKILISPIQEIILKKEQGKKSIGQKDNFWIEFKNFFMDL